MYNIILSLKMKGFVFFAIIYTVNSIQTTSTASVTSIPQKKVYPRPSVQIPVSVFSKLTSSASSASSTSLKPSALVYAKPSASVSSYASSQASVSSHASSHASSQASVSSHASHNATLYKINLIENQKVISIENKKIENKINVNTDIKKNEQQKPNSKFLTIFIAFIIIVFGYTIYKCIYIIKNTKPKKVDNGLPFYNNKYIEISDNNIYYLQPHSPKNQEQCYRRISSNSSISPESF
jgi:hypothetical protein